MVDDAVGAGLPAEVLAPWNDVLCLDVLRNLPEHDTMFSKYLTIYLIQGN